MVQASPHNRSVVAPPPEILTSFELEEFCGCSKASALIPPVSLTILGLAFSLKNIISSYIFDSLRPMIPKDSRYSIDFLRAHDHSSRNCSRSGGHDPTNTEVSTDRWFTIIVGPQRGFSLSERSTSAIWKVLAQLGRTRVVDLPAR
jgi:hypothetical protein